MNFDLQITAPCFTIRLCSWNYRKRKMFLKSCRWIWRKTWWAGVFFGCPFPVERRWWWPSMESSTCPWWRWRWPSCWARYRRCATRIHSIRPARELVVGCPAWWPKMHCSCSSASTAIKIWIKARNNEIYLAVTLKTTLWHCPMDVEVKWYQMIATLIFPSYPLTMSSTIFVWVIDWPRTLVRKLN